MRWIKPQRGDKRIKKKFAITPIEIGNEVRWLEWVTIEYEYCANKFYTLGWWAKRFINQ